MSMKEVRHVLSIIVENKSGVLTRVAGLISRRGFNVESLSVGPTDNPEKSRMTVIVQADDIAYEQLAKQLNKLVSVFKVSDLTNDNAIERELMLIKVKASPERRGEVSQLVNIFGARIMDVGKASLIIEITGSADRLASFEDLLGTYGIKEMVRTGKIAINRCGKE